LRRIPGQRVTFAESGRDVRNAIFSTSAGKGLRRFRPGDGPAGRRRIIAMIQQSGVPRTTLTAGSYRAPGMPKPRKPRKLKLQRRGSGLVVTWVPNPARFRHALYFRLSDGRRRVAVTRAGRSRFTLKRFPRKVAARVSVMGLTAANGKGPAARASIKAGKRRGR